MISTALRRTGSGFSPLSLAPFLWLDASDGSTITSSGGLVSTWADKSGNGKNVTSSGSGRPTTGSTTQNGLNTLSFNGANYMEAATAADWAFMNDGTVYMVAWTGKITSTTGVPMATEASPNLRGGMYFYKSAATQIQTAIGVGLPVLVTTQSGFLPASSSSPFIFTGILDPGNATPASRLAEYANTTANTVNNTNSAAASSTIVSPLMVGAARDNGGAPGSFATAQIAEIVIVKAPNATEANRQALRDYLNTKWAIY